MIPGKFLMEDVKKGESLLCLCSGIGLELKKFTPDFHITAVDLTPEYLVALKTRQPEITTITADVTKFIKEAADNSYDVISLMDGLEHLPKKQGRIVLEECKRVARRKVFVFTPQGFIENDIHNTWGMIESDPHQKHLSGWTIPEVEAYGYHLIAEGDAESSFGKKYKEAMYCFVKE